jgi:mRNA interferase HigB
MHVIKKQPLVDFYGRHPDARDQLEAWFAETKQACWRTPHDIKAEYPKASILKGNRVVFDIVGGSYRLVVTVRYTTDAANGTVFVRFIGTHAEYDGIDAETI